jgi:PKD repeat protein
MAMAVRVTTGSVGTVLRRAWLAVPFAGALLWMACQPVLNPDKNHPPTATATATPMTGSAPLTVTFAGSGNDADGAVAGYAWVFGDGGTSNQQNPTHVYAAQGTYKATLTVTDTDLATGTADLTIMAGTTANKPPVVTVSATPTSGLAPLTVAFSGSATDPDGTIASYTWAFGDGGTATQATTTHQYMAAGTYTATLTATDNGGATGSASVSITVSSPGNQPPTATASASPLSGPAPLSVVFTGSGSDPDGTIASYTWSFGDGGTSAQQNPSHGYAASGNYTATLTVTDNNGATGAATVSITVGTNQPPSASASRSPSSGPAPLAVAFTGSGSDPDGTIASYAWTFGDGGTSTLQNPSHTYNTAGTYTATLTVTDNGGAKGSASVTITVLVGNQPPLCNAGPDQTILDPGVTVSLNGGGSVDPDGGSLTYQWTQTAGPAVTLSGAGTATPSFVSPTATTATYTFRLTVTDNGSPPASAQDTVNVSTRVTYVNTVAFLYSDRGTQSNGNKLGCTGCHAPGKSRPQSPLTTYTEVYSWRSATLSRIGVGGSMRRYLASGEPQIIIDWFNNGAPQTN